MPNHVTRRDRQQYEAATQKSLCRERDATESQSRLQCDSQHKQVSTVGLTGSLTRSLTHSHSHRFVHWPMHVFCHVADTCQKLFPCIPAPCLCEFGHVLVPAVQLFVCFFRFFYFILCYCRSSFFLTFFLSFFLSL